MERLDLDDLDAFAAVARKRSFRGAALERSLSPSTLSQQVRDLEARLGVRLLNRTTRSVAPTAAGERLLERLGPAMSEISAALDEARAAQAQPSGTLRINAPEPALDLVLAPMVTAFLARHPALQLELTSESSLVDIVAKGYDAGVRWGESLAQDMVAVSLGPAQRYAVVASPDALGRLGRPLHPRDLLTRPCLRVRFASGAIMPWEFERAGEVVRISPQGPLVSNSSVVLKRAALEGAGFLATFEASVAEEIAQGSLVEVLEDWSETFPGPFLYYPSRHQPPSALRALVDFIVERRRASAP